MAGKVVLKLTGELDQLRIAWQVGEAMLESLEFSEDTEGTRYNILVSLQEMVTNVLRHAYCGDESRSIELEYEGAESGFSIELRDEGPPFNPLTYDMDEDAVLDEGVPQHIGGYGIMIARTVMDRIEYSRRDDQNCLRMTKLVQASSEVPAGL